MKGNAEKAAGIGPRAAGKTGIGIWQPGFGIWKKKALGIRHEAPAKTRRMYAHSRFAYRGKPISWLMIESFREARRVLDELMGDAALVAAIERAGGVIAEKLRGGGKILACGNGGSCCDAAHFVEELTGRYRAAPPASGKPDRPPVAAIVCNDAGHITCTANDYGYDAVFERWVRALGREGDVLVALSTSGNSESIVKAVEAAKRQGVTTLGLLGKGGGKIGGLCDYAIVVPGKTADRIQELHMLILHGWCDVIERRLYPECV